MKVQVYKDKKGEWRWTLFAGNNKAIADSAEGYLARADAINGLELATGGTIRDDSRTRATYLRRRDRNDPFGIESLSVEFGRES